MKAVIMAAGIGKRLMPLTKDMHKCMIVVKDKPIIMHQIEAIRACGISDIIIVGGYRMDDLKRYLGGTVEFIFNPFYETTNSVVSLWMARGGFDDDIIIVNSDIIFDRMLLNAVIADRSGVSVAVSKKWVPHKGYKVTIDNGRVVDMGMGIEPARVSGEYAGMIKIPHKYLKAFESVLDDFMKEKVFDVWFETAVVRLLKQGVPSGYVTVDDKLWFEIDTEEELIMARNSLGKG